jgi:hypothetical protein
MTNFGQTFFTAAVSGVFFLFALEHISELPQEYERARDV